VLAIIIEFIIVVTLLVAACFTLIPFVGMIRTVALAILIAIIAFAALLKSTEG
jgi:hypothetical protein